MAAVVGQNEVAVTSAQTPRDRGQLDAWGGDRQLHDPAGESIDCRPVGVEVGERLTAEVGLDCGDDVWQLPTRALGFELGDHGSGVVVEAAALWPRGVIGGEGVADELVDGLVAAEDFGGLLAPFCAHLRE